MFSHLFKKGGLSLERLNTLVAAVEAGSVARAAGSTERACLYYRQIKELESYFGFKLGERQGRQVVFNDAARRLAGIARELFLSLEGFQESKPSQRVDIKLAAYQSLMHWVVLPRIAQLQEKMPQANWQMEHRSTREIIRGLEELTIDVALVRQNAVRAPLKCEHLLKLKYAVFADRNAVGEAADSEGILARVPLAMQESTEDLRAALEEGAAGKGLKLEPQLRCMSAVEVCRAVAGGKYCGILPTVAAQDLPAGRFVAYEATFLRGYERNVCVAWNTRMTGMRPVVERAVTALTKTLKPEEPKGGAVTKKGNARK